MNILEIKADTRDINEHVQTLTTLSRECKHVTEMGVRHVVSTWFLALGLPNKLVSIDIEEPPQDNLQDIKDFCRNKLISFEFILSDTTKMEIEETDLLFIDTLHTRDQLQKELDLHSDKVKKYIVLHDTESCKLELWIPIGNLLSKGKWKIKQHYQNNNGLTVCERI